MAVLQISITLDEERLRFLEEWGGNRSAAVAEAVPQWRDQHWPLRLAETSAALNDADAAELARYPS